MVRNSAEKKCAKELETTTTTKVINISRPFHLILLVHKVQTQRERKFIYSQVIEIISQLEKFSLQRINAPRERMKQTSKRKKKNDVKFRTGKRKS